MVLPVRIERTTSPLPRECSGIDIIRFFTVERRFARKVHFTCVQPLRWLGVLEAVRPSLRPH